MTDALNLYINFLLYAIVGRLGPADEILRKYQTEIYSAAAASLRGVVPNFTIYRGVLLHPNEVREGKMFGKHEYAFVSFSQDRDVARWFADVNSFMSGYVKKMKPWVKGYMIDAVVRQEDLLFVATAQPALCKLLTLAATMHPHIDAEQLRWNLTTQKEVIIKPHYDQYDVKPYETSEEETRRLDKKLTHPWILE